MNVQKMKALLIMLLAVAAYSVPNAGERAILGQFYNGTIGKDKWKQGCDGGWSTNAPDVCTWQGITCTGDKAHVMGINIGARNLVGAIPSSSQIPSIFGLRFVKIIFISPGPDLFLEGDLPDDFNHDHPVLEQLQLTGHELAGRIPQSFYSSTALQKIDFHSNQFQGTIVEAIGNLINVIYFSLADNKMFGPLPAAMAKLEKLTALGLAQNSFTGGIDVIAGLPVLVILFLRNNLFEGVIPMFSASIQVFDVDHNSFTAIAPGLCSNKNSMKALTDFGGCSTDWPRQAINTCCVANTKLNSSIQEQCPALANCFPNAMTSYDCHILTDQCAPVSGSKGKFPTLQACQTACSKKPTPAPPLERAILEQFYNGTVGTNKWKQGCDGGWATSAHQDRRTEAPRRLRLAHAV
jgi:hypothetical protein